jgi:hypothetical protein
MSAGVRICRTEDTEDTEDWEGGAGVDGVAPVRGSCGLIALTIDPGLCGLLCRCSLQSTLRSAM